MMTRSAGSPSTSGVMKAIIDRVDGDTFSLQALFSRTIREDPEISPKFSETRRKNPIAPRPINVTFFMSFIIPFILLILPLSAETEKLPETAGNGRRQTLFLLLYSKSGRVSTNYGFSDQKIHSEVSCGIFGVEILTK